MTGPYQRSRIHRIANALITAESLRQDGRLDSAAYLLELQRTIHLDLEQEVVIAYLLATQAFTEATAGGTWGA